MAQVYFSHHHHYYPTKPPLTVIMWGAPGTGKSTTAAEVFAGLKHQGRNIELIPEVAKDLVWEGRHSALSDQEWLTAKQHRRMDRVGDQCEALVTDTSTLLALIYGTVTPAFRAHLIDNFRRRRTLNIFLTRNAERGYNPQGRTQNEAGAIIAGQKIRMLLNELEINHHLIKAATPATAPYIIEETVKCLNWLAK